MNVKTYGIKAPWLRVALRVAAIVLVTAAAWMLRMRAVELLPIDYDEDDYLRAAQQYQVAIQNGDWGALTRLNYRPEHPPLAKLAYGMALVPLPQVSEIPDRPTSASPAASLPQPHLRVARTVAAASNTLEVLLLACLSPLAGLWLAIHTFTIKYTAQVMLEGLPAFTAALTVLTYEQSRRHAGVGERGHTGWLVISAVFLGLTAAGKYLYCVAGLAVLVHWLWQTYPTTKTGGQNPFSPAELKKIRFNPFHPLRLFARWLGPALLWGLLAVAVFVAASPYLWPAPVARLWDSLAYHGAYTQSQDVQGAGLPLWQPMVWLTESVPWHPGVFVVCLDAVITLLAVLGLPSLWRCRPLYALWLLIGFGFLLIWPTKWPQYILVLTFPLSLAAAEGVRARLWLPLRAWRRDWRRAAPATGRVMRRELRAALPWLAPGVIVLALITFYPLIFQVGIALTDFNTTSIKDGIQGGIGRELWKGVTGRAEPVQVDIFARSRPSSKTVRYVGIGTFLDFISAGGMGLLVFEGVWTAAAVGAQAALGVGVALLLHRPGVCFKPFWQTLFVLPWAIPEFVGALVWMQIFDPHYGWFFLGASFPETPGYPLAQTLAQWQQNPNLAFWVLLIAGTWMGFPLMMLAALAGLKMIPTEVYDAAAIDGANGWQQFRAITWPLLLPLLAPALIIRGIYAFNQFYLFYVLNPPYPLTTLASLSYYIFDSTGKYAVSAVINVFTVIVLILSLLWFNRVSRAGKGVTYA